MQNKIAFKEYDISNNPEHAKIQQEKFGTKIVPTIVIHDSSLFGLIKKTKVFIGFEQNKHKILPLLE